MTAAAERSASSGRPAERAGLGLWSLGAAIRLAWRRALRGRGVRVALVAVLVVLAFPTVIALLHLLAAWGLLDPIAWVRDLDSASLVESTHDYGFYRLLVFLFPLLFAAGLVAEEVEGRTWSYLAVNAAGRNATVLGGWLVAAALCLAFLAAGMLAIHVIGYAADPGGMIEGLGATGRAIAGAALLTVAYCAIAFFWSVMTPSAARVLTAVHLGIFEWGLANSIGMLRLLSLNTMGRAIGGLEEGGFLTDWGPDPSVPVAVAVIVAGAVVWLGLALFALNLRELRQGRA